MDDWPECQVVKYQDQRKQAIELRNQLAHAMAKHQSLQEQKRELISEGHALRRENHWLRIQSEQLEAENEDLWRDICVNHTIDARLSSMIGHHRQVHITDDAEKPVTDGRSRSLPI
jgi:regulator of replication initiation timing